MKRFVTTGRTWVPHEGGYLLTTTEHARSLQLQRRQGEDARDRNAPQRTPGAAPGSADAPARSSAHATGGLHLPTLLGFVALGAVLLASALAYSFAARR